MLISEQNGNRIFMPTSNAEEQNDPTQQQTLAGILDLARENNAIILYHNFNHYQTVIGFEINQNKKKENQK